MKLIKQITDLNKAINNEKELGFVPTMGNLHKGHESLINISKKRCKKTLVSIFVNPAQFNNKKDYKNYPKSLSKDLKILAFTILTSLDRSDLDMALIKSGTIPDLVMERAGLAFDAGADGVIASPQEAALIRALPEAEGKLIVTPGVRPDGAVLGDQKRVTTPARAVADGADHIVVGRPIWQAQFPSEVTAAILAELSHA